MSDEYQSYADCWVERYRASNPERAREIESRGNPSLYPLISNTNCINTAEQSKTREYAWTEGASASRYGINPVVESAILIRKELKLTQASFARCLNISPRTLRDWEQGRRYPSGAALTLLQWAIDRPDYIREIYELDGV
jgi:DNA-binding transcriptional regulator YiaG